MGNTILADAAPLGITSAYRNPAAEIAAATSNGAKPAPNSRHEAGDGVDLTTTWSGKSLCPAIYNAAAASKTGACFEPAAQETPKGSTTPSHAHVDWRAKTGPSNNWAGQTIGRTPRLVSQTAVRRAGRIIRTSVPHRLMTAWILALAALSATAQNAAERKPSPAANEVVQEKGDPTTGSMPNQALLDQLKAPRLGDRMAALRVIVGKDPALPMLKNARVRIALVNLFRRETNNARGTGLGERMDFERYYDFLSQAVQKIASGYQAPEAWKALVYSNYAAGSPFGEWVAKQPESYALLLAWVDDEDGMHRYQGARDVGLRLLDQP